MDREKENVWTRRSNIHNNEGLGSGSGSGSSSESRSFGSKRSNPFNNIAPLSTSTMTSPISRTATGASSAFGLGSGAFGFGSAKSSTPKTPASGSAYDFSTVTKKDLVESHPLNHTWTIWYRPPTSKNSDYEKSIKPICRMSTVIDFWKVYTHLQKPSKLQVVSDYHFFKDGIRPVWEDEENRRGGKWILRLKKGVADRYWELLLMSMVGNQFAEASDEVCGAVLSVRSGEDVISIWTKNDGGRNIKIRETVKRVLELPLDTTLIWKSHDDSIAQRTALDHARQEKSGQRRTTLSIDESNLIA